MAKDKDDKNGGKNDKGGKKKSYQKPRLDIFGNLTQVTALSASL